MKKHYFARGRGMSIPFLLISIFLFSGTGLVFGQLLDPVSHPKFENQLPVIKDLGLRIDMTNPKKNVMPVKMEETFQDLGLVDGLGNPFLTRVWGYKFDNLPVTYPGATIVAMKDKPFRIKWTNNLPGHFLPVDPSLHMAHPMDLMTPGDVASWYAAGNVPTVTHLHGGHTESASDGLPEAWYTQDNLFEGPQFVKGVYSYDNDQEAATLWYHDHALGITRLNVYAGLAGFYLLRDENEMGLIEDGTLPGGDYEIEIVIQDRMFDANGQLFWPAYPGEGEYDDFLADADYPASDPSILAEFFGDFILVNGKAWPNLNVEPRKYRFRLLNGSDSRFYKLKFSDNMTPFILIGTDDGLIEKAVSLDELVIAPGERYDVVVDFAGKFNQEIILQNTGPDEPFKGNNFNTDVTRPTGQIMKFSVNKQFNAGVDETNRVASGDDLNTITDHEIDEETPVRQLVLFEGADEYGRLQPLLGTMNEGSLAWFEPITENPALNATEIWEVYNATEDAHPIHLHLVSFQILNRESFTGEVNDKDQAMHNGTTGTGGILDASTVELGDDAIGPEEHEAGWKDTFIVPPGKVGRVVAKFDREGRYVWHCHILSHEDHEMMRPFYVGDIPTKGKNINTDGYILGDPTPNPINIGQPTDITFTIPSDQHVTYKIFDNSGYLISSKIDYYPAGTYTITIPGSNFIDTGDYILTFYAGDFYDFRRIYVE